MINKKLRVGFLLLQKQAGVGGLEKVLVDVVNGLQDEVEPFVYFIEEPRDFSFLKKFKNPRCFRVPKLLRNKHLLRPKVLYKCFLELSTKKLFSSLLNDKLDVLLVLDLGKSLLKYSKHLKKIKEHQNIKIVSWSHTSAHNLSTKNIESMIIFDHFFAISDGMARQLREYGFDNVSVVYNPIQNAPLINRGNNHFIYVGRIDKNKRVYELIDAFYKVANSYSFDIYGSSGSIVEDDMLKKYIQRKGLTEQVRFHGWKKEPWNEVDKASVLVLNSKNEGLPLVLIEAMMRGVACLSSNCETGPSDIIIPEVNGWLYDVDDETMLQSYLEQIISGKLVLPAPNDVQKSVEKFSSTIVLGRFKKLLVELS